MTYPFNIQQKDKNHKKLARSRIGNEEEIFFSSVEHYIFLRTKHIAKKIKNSKEYFSLLTDEEKCEIK